MVKIPDGCILLARQIKSSDIWVNKPAWWLKVWNYILMEVNHKDNSFFKRGENMFSRKIIYSDCNLAIDKIEAKSVDNVIRWLRATTQITTRKTTRGIVINVSKYAFYQNLNNYKNDTKNCNINDEPNDTLTTQERHRNDTINKNDKNVKKERIYTILSPAFEQLWNKYPLKDGKKAALKHYTSSVKNDTDIKDINKAINNYLLHLSKNIWKPPKNAATWFNNWRDWVEWTEPGAIKPIAVNEDVLKEIERKRAEDIEKLRNKAAEAMGAKNVQH